MSPEVMLRCIGENQFLFDSADCLLYEPGPRYADLFRACQRRDRIDKTSEWLSLSTGCSANEAHTFVLKVLRKFEERGFLDQRQAQ